MKNISENNNHVNIFQYRKYNIINLMNDIFIKMVFIYILNYFKHNYVTLRQCQSKLVRSISHLVIPFSFNFFKIKVRIGIGAFWSKKDAGVSF